MAVTLAIAIVSIWLHELGHAGASRIYGDRLGGRRWALNPLVNLDPIFSFLFPLVTCLVTGGASVFGTGRPFLLQRADWRVLIAGPTVNLALAAIGIAVGWWHLTSLNLLLFIGNMLPIQPLDGWGLLHAFKRWRERRTLARVTKERIEAMKMQGVGEVIE